MALPTPAALSAALSRLESPAQRQAVAKTAKPPATSETLRARLVAARHAHHEAGLHVARVEARIAKAGFTVPPAPIRKAAGESRRPAIPPAAAPKALTSADAELAQLREMGRQARALLASASGDAQRAELAALAAGVDRQLAARGATPSPQVVEKANGTPALHPLRRAALAATGTAPEPVRKAAEHPLIRDARRRAAAAKGSR
ncbi:hypothetical protein [Roseomonas elaeocarpi]|uniref:Uncharacterized protein n=1 Tax=Roseomonas elaeocarpi TaxID=907779 RepID=A0ABV6JTA5_9PROT